MRKVLLGMSIVLLGCTLVSAASAADRDVAGKCRSAEFKALLKQTRAKAQCHERSLRLGVPVDQECLNRAESRGQRMTQKMKRGRGCQSLDRDQAALELRIDEFLADLRRAIEPGSAAGAGVSPKAGATPKAKETTAAEATPAAAPSPVAGGKASAKGN